MENEPKQERVKSTPFKNALLLLVVTIISLAVCELGLGLFMENSFEGQVPKAIVDLRMQIPNNDINVDISLIDSEQPFARFRVDDRAYIRPSFQFDNPQVTIAFLGGSTTECAAVKEDVRFHGLVSKLFDESGKRVNTLNAARSGNTLHDSLNILLNHVVLDHPDIVVVMNVANDVGVLSELGGDYRARSARPLSFGDAVNWFKSTISASSNVAGVLRKSLIVLRRRGVQAEPAEASASSQRTDPRVADTLPSDLYEQRLRIFVDMARRFEIVPVLMTQPLSGIRSALTPEWAEMGSQERFNEIVRRVGVDEQVLVIDLAKYVEASIPAWDEPMNLFYDGMHVTDFGSEVYATAIMGELEPLVNAMIQQDP